MVEAGHKGHSKKYMELNEMDVLKWPAQSPELNLIEALWGDVEVGLGQVWGKVSDVETLEAAVKAAWNVTISGERLEGLIGSMPDRRQAVIDVDGYPILASGGCRSGGSLQNIK